MGGRARVGPRCGWALGACWLVAAACAARAPAEPREPATSQVGAEGLREKTIAEAPPESRSVPSGADAGAQAIGPPLGPRDLRRLPELSSLVQGEQELDQLRLLIKAGGSDREIAMMTWRAALLAQALAQHPDNDEHGVAKMKRAARGWLHDVGVTQRFAKHIQADEALYMLGVLTLHEDPKYGQGSLRELIMRYPTSEWVGPTYLVFAEELFGKRNAQGAGQLFDKAFQLSKPDRAYALAMQGRCLLMADSHRNAQPAKALAKLVRAWGMSRDQEAVRDTTDAARVRRLVEQDLVPAYADAGRPRKAVDFFQSQLEHPAAMRVMTALVAAYKERGEHGSAAQMCASAPTLPGCATP